MECGARCFDPRSFDPDDGDDVYQYVLLGHGSCSKRK